MAALGKSPTISTPRCPHLSDTTPHSETPWLSICAHTTTTMSASDHNDHPHTPDVPTTAPFSPPSASRASRSSTFQVHQKSPLLVATPPQITRALSRAYPWINTLDHALALLTWTSADPWESFIVVAVFWGATLYGAELLKWAGNVVAVALLVAAMYLRHRHNREAATAGSGITTLDEIIETLVTLNTRVELVLGPIKTMLQVLSSEKNATTATTRPKLTTLFVRILLLTPIWLALAIWPLHIITPRRIVLTIGTAALSWHSRPAKVCRTILWRSGSVRWLTERATGLSLVPETLPTLPPRGTKPAAAAAQTSGTVNASTIPAAASPGVSFTFSIYENQRRWLGVGWTSSMFVYERAPWTDEHLSPSPPPEEFVLPEPHGGRGVRWRWVEGEDWYVESGTPGVGGKGHGLRGHHHRGTGDDAEGWWYYDNKWENGRWGVDGWGKYTRRRKLCRRAELVEEDHEEFHVAEKKVERVRTPGPPGPPGPPLPLRASEREQVKEREQELLEEDQGGYSESEDEGVVRVVEVDVDGKKTALASTNPKEGRPPPLPSRNSLST